MLIDATHVADEEAINEQVRVSSTATRWAVTLTVDGATLRCTDRLFLAAREGTTGTIVVNNGGQVIASRITLGRIGDGVIILNDGLVDCSKGQVEFGLNYRQRHPHPQRRVIQGLGLCGQQQGPNRAKRGSP